MLDFLNINKKIQEARTRMSALQDSLSKEEMRGESGGGMVVATVNGQQRLLRLDVDDSLWVGDKQQMGLDLIVGAVNQAMEKAKQRSKERMAEEMKDILPMAGNIDLGGLL